MLSFVPANLLGIPDLGLRIREYNHGKADDSALPSRYTGYRVVHKFKYHFLAHFRSVLRRTICQLYRTNYRTNS